MAAAQDVEHRQMLLNSLGPSASQSGGDGIQIVEPQGSQSQLRVEVTVLRAYNVPHKKQFGLKRRFFVTVTNHATTKKTESIQIDGQTVRWNQRLGAFVTQRSSHLILCLHEKRLTHRDVVIGTHEIPIPVESQNDVPFPLGNGKAEPSITLYLTIAVSANVASPILPNNPPKILIKADDSPAEEATKPSMSGGSTQYIAPEPLSPLPDHFPVKIGVLTSHSQAEVSLTEDHQSLTALRRADEAMKLIDGSTSWEMAVGRIRWVVDTLGPIAELSPYAKMAYSLLSAIPKTLLEQYQRDDNVRTLLEAMHDAFDFAHHEDTLKSIKPESKQAQILTLMLQDVCNCCDFIQSYAKDSQFWKRTLKNMAGGAETKIEPLSAALVEHRRAFLDQATITTEITAFQILDDVGIISAKVDWISTQLKWVSSQVPDIELDAKIREIPYGTGSRFTPDKGCLTGTRVAFLDFIVNWVDDPASERSLVLFGQAGTGKSSIAHEIARRFNKMHRLTSSFIFLRKEQPKPYHLFTTLARDLSDRYPSFRTALGIAVKDNSSLRVGTRDYRTLFESLILEPLKDLHIVGPILVVIDALDESGDVTGENGLHTFLVTALSKLPSNFRVLITSRPEHDIESAFVGDKSARIKVKYMTDPELATTTHEDILVFLQEKLPSDEFRKYGEKLAIRAEGLFQWAAVACGYISNPPDFFGFSKKKCIEHLLKLTADRHRQDPLDDLYKEVLEGYFIHQESRLLFRSVVGQLITSFEPLTIRSLTTLRQHASYDDGDDGDAVAILLRRLGSLLSNVNSSNESLPIVPLHTSFRDFLIREEKSGDFCVSLHDAHHQLAHSCLGLLVNDLKFNICDLESSYLANKDVDDLNFRIDENIPPALLYACRFWDDHLEHIDFETELFRNLRTFVENKFLFWLECLSLIGDIRLALPALSSLNGWLASGQGVSQTELEKFTAFINDASAFVRYFGIAMAKSAPHVYLSTLPFAPTSSLVSMHYSSMFPRILRVKSGRLSHWPSSEMAISNVGGKVLSIALSPDGRRIASGSDDGTIRVWNATTGETAAGPFTEHTESVTSVAFSPDGQHIMSGSHDRTIRVWNATTGETAAGPYSGHTEPVTSVAFSPDGQRIVSGSLDQTIRVWNITTGETAASPFTGYAFSAVSVAFSPDGLRVVSGSDDQTIRVWNTATGETMAGPFKGHTGTVTSVAFSPDGQRIVSGSLDQKIRVWNAAKGKKVAGPFIGHMGIVTSVEYSPDGRRVVSGSDDRTIRVWNAATGETVAGPFTGHTGTVMSVAFSPDGQRIISGSHDGTIRVWNVTMGETAAGLAADPSTGHVGSVGPVALSPDGQHIVTGSYEGAISVRNATTGEITAFEYTGHMEPVTLSKKTKKTKKIKIESVTSVAFSPDGRRIVSGSDNGTIRVWNATTGWTAAGLFAGHRKFVMSVAFSPDGQCIVSGSDDGTIRVWNATTGEMAAGPFTGYKSVFISVAFLPDGRNIVSGSHHGAFRVWNATTGETTVGPYHTGHTAPVTSVALSPDGQRFVSGSFDQTIRVWSITTGETAASPFTGHAESVTSVAFSPHGQRIVSGSGDGTIRVWNASTGEMMADPLIGHTDSVGFVAFSPDGQRIISVSEDRTIRVWNITTEKTKPIGHIDFTDRSTINEGWIRGSKGELLVWIPPIHRTLLFRPNNIWVAGDNETHIDFSTLVHGRSWTTCIDT